METQTSIKIINSSEIALVSGGSRPELISAQTVQHTEEPYIQQPQRGRDVVAIECSKGGCKIVGLATLVTTAAVVCLEIVNAYFNCKTYFALNNTK